MKKSYLRLSVYLRLKISISNESNRQFAKNEERIN